MTPVRVVLLLSGTLAIAGCGATQDATQRAALAALSLKVPHPASAPASKAVSSCGPVTASLRPPASLPAPGAMPAGSYMARIQRRGYLIAGVDQNTLLFAYFNPLDGQLEGLEIDLLRELARAIFGNPDAIQFRAVTTAERLPVVEDGAVDVVADAITITCARRREVDFSTVYYDAGQKLLVPRNSGAASLADMVGKRVCATAGSTSLAALVHQQPRAIPFTVPQRTDCLVALQQDEVNAVTSDDSILLGFKAQDPDTKIIGARFADEPYGMAISKSHPDFVRFTNAVLAQLRADGGWHRIVSRWLGRFGSVPVPPRPVYSG